MKFPEILKTLRIEKGISQRQLACDLQISIGLISYYETGKAEPTLTNIIKLANYFKISTDFLLGLEK